MALARTAPAAPATAYAAGDIGASGRETTPIVLAMLEDGFWDGSFDLNFPANVNMNMEERATK